MENIKLREIENFILNYKKNDFFIKYLTLINLNLIDSIILGKFFVCEIKNNKFNIEFEFEKTLFNIELGKDYFYMQIDSVEKYFFEENNSKIENIINELFLGCYIIKYYYTNTNKIKALKFIWTNKVLKDLNFKYKFNFFNFDQIKRIDQKKGVQLRTKATTVLVM